MLPHNKLGKNKLIYIIPIIIVVTLALLYYLNQSAVNGTSLTLNTSENATTQDFQKYNLGTNTSKTLIDLKKVLSGGPSKDGIPAIVSPQFVNVQQASTFISDEVIGVYLNINGTEKFYPYNILVWHEIVNDAIDNKPFAVTFCPLCGSAIVYERNINNETLEFGVSGLLYESNLLMYDKKSESLWSQIEGRAVVGELTGTKLKIINSQLISFAEVKEKHPSTRVLSTDTGHNRDYTIYPYQNYDETEEFYFPVTYKGEDYEIFAKEIMYASNIDKVPIAFVLSDLKQEKTAAVNVSNKNITATINDEEIKIIDSQGNQYPGYYTMWFSWANHNLSDGVNNDREGMVWFK